MKFLGWEVEPETAFILGNLLSAKDDPNAQMIAEGVGGYVASIERRKMGLVILDLATISAALYLAYMEENSDETQ